MKNHDWKTTEVSVLATKDITMKLWSNYQLYNPDLDHVEPECVIRLSDFVPAELLKYTRLIGEDTIKGPEGTEEGIKAFRAAVNECMDSTSSFTYGFFDELSDEYITETETYCTRCYKTK